VITKSPLTKLDGQFCLCLISFTLLADKGHLNKAASFRNRKNSTVTDTLWHFYRKYLSSYSICWCYWAAFMIAVLSKINDPLVTGNVTSAQILW